ncbi:MAG: ABC transporter substrate-binding protein, partial [Chloroflexota bacterium]
QLFFAFITQNQYLKDARVRQALALVYDYKGHVEKARNGHADVAAGPLPKAILYHDDSIPPSETNVEKAKQLMAEAGHPKGGFELTIAYQGTAPEEVAAVQILQAGASEIGVTIKPLAMEWPAKVGVFSKQETAPAMGTTWVFPGYPDPDQFMFRLGHSSQAGNEGLNFAWFKNPKMDELLVAGQTELDPKKRAEIYKEAQQIWVKDVPYANVVVGRALSAQRDYVKGYKWTSAHSLAPEVYPISLEGKPER